MLTTCLSPVRIKNKSTGEFLFVKCGHCANCRHAYTQSIRRRLDAEMEYSAATLFITLTYDNNSIPLVTDDGDGHLFAQSKRVETVDLRKYFPNLDVFMPYIKSSDPTQKFDIAINSKLDIQKFLKRLRRYVEYDKDSFLSDVAQADREIRYWITSEYGPKTFRCHYHGLLFFKSERVAEAVRSNYLFKSWKLCDKRNIDCQFVFSNAAKYVSKYVTLNTKLPYLLQIKPFRTFSLFSRFPTIGCRHIFKDDLSSMLKERNVKYHQTFSDGSTGLVDVELPHSLQYIRYFFPKSFNPTGLTPTALFEVLSGINICRSRVGAFTYREISESFPNLIKYVKTKFHLFYKDAYDVKVQPYLGYNDVYDRLSWDQRWFGIPQNRMLICRAILYMAHFNISVWDYCERYFTLQSIIHSDSFKSSFEYEQHIVDFNLMNSLDKFVEIYPTFILTLPPRMFDIDLITEMQYGDFLSPFHISISDFYDDVGNILDKYKYKNLRKLHTVHTEFTLHTIKIKREKFKFDNTVMINSLLNSELL